MKSIRNIITVAMVALVAFFAAVPAAGQLKFGIKAGAAINDLKFDTDILSKDNRAGFTGGIMLEFTVPLIGVGLDASAMYVHRTAEFQPDVNADMESSGRDYIDIPINLKYKLSIPVVEKVIKPFVTTGPSFAFLVSKKDVNEFFKNKTCDIAWNFGFGLEFLSHVQIAASYGIGLTNTLEFVGLSGNKATIEGKNRYWTVTAAYLF